MSTMYTCTSTMYIIYTDIIINKFSKKKKSEREICTHMSGRYHCNIAGIFLLQKQKKKN